MCARSSLKRELQDMSFDSFKLLLDKVLKESYQYNTCTFSGFGEPLLNSDCVKMIKYAKSLGLKTLLLTNGYNLLPEVYAELKNAIDSIRTSFYGYNEETYSNAHNRSLGAYQRVRRNLLNAVSNKHCELILNYIVMDGINDDYKQWIKQWENKVDLLEVWKPHNWANSKCFRELQSNKVATCGRPFTGPLQINVDMSVQLCCFDINGELIVGNLGTQSLSEIFESQKFKEILQQHYTGCYKDILCNTCDQRNTSKDGIMLYNSRYDINKRINVTSTMYEKLGG
jgi:organic radical activating enzyme